MEGGKSRLDQVHSAFAIIASVNLPFAASVWVFYRFQ
jgi:hypothetical protein